MSYRGPISRDNEINVLFYRIYEFSQSCTTELHTPRIAWPFCTQTFKQCAPFKDILPRPRGPWGAHVFSNYQHTSDRYKNKTLSEL